MTSNDKLFFYVAKGPGKFDLMVSLFQRGQSVDFFLEGAKDPIRVRIAAIEQEDGSFESWCFKAYLLNHHLSLRINGYFSTNSRKGHLTFEVPYHYDVKVSEGREKVTYPKDQLAVEKFVDQLRA